MDLWQDLRFVVKLICNGCQETSAVPAIPPVQNDNDLQSAQQGNVCEQNVC